MDEFDAVEEENEEDEDDGEMGVDDEDQDEVNSLNIQKLVQVCFHILKFALGDLIGMV